MCTHRWAPVTSSGSVDHLVSQSTAPTGPVKAQGASTSIAATDHDYSSLWNVIDFIMEFYIMCHILWLINPKWFIIFNAFLVYGIFSYTEQQW